MNCLEFWDHMPRRGREISEDQTSHLEQCSACAAQWAPHRALEAGLEAMGEEWRKLEAPPRVEVGLTAAFRAQTNFQSRRSPRLPWWPPVLAWASAAAAMIALGVFLIHGWQPSATAPDEVAAPHRTVQAAPEMASAYGEAVDESLGLGEGFIRLPNATRLEPDEHVDVVRVEVPGSAMIALGISMSEDRATETVLADVALGSDGMARAVRFVNEGGSL